MTTSGSYSFNLTTQQIIQTSFERINHVDIGDPISDKDYQFALKILNMMLKHWETVDGIPLWKRKQATLFLQKNQNSYNIGNVTGADHCTAAYLTLTLNSSVAQGVNSITVSSVSGLSNGMFIGLEQDDGTRIWGTITNITSNTITTTFTTTTTAQSSNTVISYTSKINRPLKILRGTNFSLINSTETTIMELAYNDWFDLPIKKLSGNIVTNWYYDRILNNSLPYTGVYYIFPTPNTVKNLINFTYQDSIQDMINSNDTADMPQEWLDAITTNLGCKLAKIYGKFTELQILQPEADLLLKQMEDFDSDSSSLQLGMDNTIRNSVIIPRNIR